jgi:hypothetical protein
MWSSRPRSLTVPSPLNSSKPIGKHTASIVRSILERNGNHMLQDSLLVWVWGSKLLRNVCHLPNYSMQHPKRELSYIYSFYTGDEVLF